MSTPIERATAQESFTPSEPSSRQWWSHIRTGRSCYIKEVNSAFGKSAGFVTFQYDDTGRHCSWDLPKFIKQFKFQAFDV